MTIPQPGILAPVPKFSRYMEFGAIPDRDIAPVLRELAARPMDQDVVVGIGPGLVRGLGREIAGLRPFPGLSGPGCEIPSTQADIWGWVRGSDAGRVTHTGRALARLLQPAFRRDRLLDAFKYEEGLDLTGYVDGTENPEGDAAIAAAIVKGAGGGLDGASFVAVQHWVHDLDHFEALPQDERDNIFGRRQSNNEEFDEAPVSAHVKRTAQESFDPEAFVVRRSMPWSDANGEGLVFVAFGASLAPYEALLGRMTGQEDNILDGLFRFTRPVTGSYFWCPPTAGGHLDLGALGI